MSWSPFPLDKLGTVSRGRSRHRPRDAAHLYGGPYPFLQTSDVKHAGLYLTEFYQTYSEAGLAQSKLWPKGTLCITIAANIADTSILSIEACFPDSIIGFIPDPKKADARFIKYLFDASFKRQFKTFTQGAAQDNLSQGKLLSIDFSVPTIDTQARIASILSAYDDLIENNRRRIVLLEDAARQLYKEWFIRLHFPGHKQTKIVDGVPEGWERCKMGTLASKIGSGATPRGGSSAYQSFGVTLIRSQNVYDFNFTDDGLAHIDDTQAAELSNVTVQENDVLLNITGASVARCCLVPRRHLPARVNQHVMIIRIQSDKCAPLFVLHALNSEQNKAALLSIAKSGGATREALTKDIVASFEILVPTAELISSFTETIEPMFELSEQLFSANTQLARARDLLLPKLMSGRLAV